jgi:hypothetical protein
MAIAEGNTKRERKEEVEEQAAPTQKHRRQSHQAAILEKRRELSRGRRCSAGDTGGSGSNMEYAWMEPKHDPIATDTNLAEIDFEDFRNEDLAYAFSCGVSEY